MTTRMMMMRCQWVRAKAAAVAPAGDAGGAGSTCTSGVAGAMRVTVAATAAATAMTSMICRREMTTIACSFKSSSFPSRTRATTAATAATAASLLPNTRTFASDAAAQDNKSGNANKFAYTMLDVTKRFQDGRSLFSNVRLSFFDGAKIGILGHNGSGKSSFLKIIAGVDKDFDGEAYAYEGYKIGYLQQEPELDPSKNVFENVLHGIGEKWRLLQQYEAVSKRFEDPEADMDALVNEQAALQARIDELNCWDLNSKVHLAMQALRCPPPESPVQHLSGGEKRRVALCRLLLSEPDILLLDEPTNHLDAESVAWLEKFLDQYRGLVIAITHDRYFLDNVAGYILEIDAGRLYPFKGNYQAWLQHKQERLSQEKKRNVAMDKHLARELEWMRANQRGQQSKSRARVRQVLELQEARAERMRNRRAEGGAILIPEGPPLHSNTVVRMTGLEVYNDGALLFRLPELVVSRNDVIGIVGPNGTGKTTLLKVLTGVRTIGGGKPGVNGEDPLEGRGTVQIAPDVRFAYNAQQRDMNPDHMVWQEVVGTYEFVQITSDYAMPARAYVAQFNFNGTDQQKRIGQLSGGERNRVSLAKAMREGMNVLLLDEPTNDLDVDTLRRLEEALAEWHGTAIVVSHDRWFLDRICTRLLIMGDGDDGKLIRVFDGNWTDYERAMRAQFGSEWQPGAGVGGKAQRFRKLGY